VDIVESLQTRFSATGDLQRIAVSELNGKASRTTIALACVPPLHEFPLHAHPHSEDCFFVLSGSGEVFGAHERFPISEIAGVWVPPGVPHGLASGPQYVLEIGIQSPPGPTVEPIDSGTINERQLGIAVASISLMSESSGSKPEWNPVFAERLGWRYLDPQFCFPGSSQQVRAAANGYELLIIVARGAVELQNAAVRVEAVTVVQLKEGESEVLNSLEGNTVLLSIRAAA
jgi:mannose-6-phosphate isomerase-like protein (cupin superfamily)